MKEFWKAVGERVRAAREAAGLTQLQLARKVGKSAATISTLEGGTQGTKAPVLWKIALALGVPLDDLMPRSGRPEVELLEESVAFGGRYLPSKAARLDESETERAA